MHFVIRISLRKMINNPRLWCNSKRAIHYHAQTKLLDKGRVIKGLGVCNDRDLEHYDLQTFCPSVVINRPLRYYSQNNKEIFVL